MTTPPRDADPGHSAQPFEATVRTSSRAQYEGRVTHTHDRVVTIEFAREDAPLFQIAEELTVSFRSREIFEPFVARSRVIFRQENPFRSRYRFRFREKDAQTLNALFKRRTASRVRTDDDVAVDARACGAESATRVTCTLRDISRSGLSLRVDERGEAQLCRADRLQLGFRLPGDPELFDLAASVRYRQLADDGVQYGLELDRSEDAHARRTAERIEAYIQRRKAAIIEKALGASWLPKAK